MARKLFLSFDGVIKAWGQKEIQWEDLAMGLFFLRCTRREVNSCTAPGSPLARIYFGSREETNFYFARSAYHFVQVALILAEIKKRCLWLKEGEMAQYGHLNLLLHNSGIKTNLSPGQSLFPAEFQAVNPDEVARLVKQAGLNLEVVP